MRTSTLLLLIFLCSFSSAGTAQELPKSLVQLSIAPLNGAIESQLESILRGTIELALAQSYTARQTTLELKILYTISGSRVSLYLSLIDTSVATRVQDEAMERDLDPQFDQAVAVFVSALLQEGSSSVLKASALPPSTGMPASAAYAEESSPQLKSSIINGSQYYQALPPLSKDATRPPKNPASFEMGLGAFLPLEEAGSYFKAASRFHARIGRYLNKGRNWNLGIASSFIAFSVEGETQAIVRNVISMIGGEFAYSFMPAKTISPWFALGAGPALIVIDSEATEAVNKALTHVYSGLGAHFQLSPGLDLGLGISLSMFFDFGYGASFLLMGINPSLSAQLEL